MKLISITLAAGVFALGACERIAEDPDVKEARAAIEGAIDDEGAALKKVREEAQATREAQPEEQNTDESQTGD
jgi:hypothetical protein